MSYQDQEKSVLITGCSDGGIGSALALNFQARGFHVFATARNVSKMSALANLPSVTILTLDVQKSTHIAAAVAAVQNQAGGKLDILINNSGRNHFAPVLDIDIIEARHIFDVNFWAPLAIIQAFSPLVITARGTIVNVTSISGHMNVPYMGLYAASKMSLEILSETLRLEVQPFGVGVLSVVTGAVQTNGQTYFEDWKLPDGSLFVPLDHLIAERTRGHDGVMRMALTEYAQRVTNDIIRGATGKIWHGTNADGVRFGKTFMLQSLLDNSFIKACGLDQLAESSK